MEQNQFGILEENEKLKEDIKEKHELLT